MRRSKKRGVINPNSRLALLRDLTVFTKKFRNTDRSFELVLIANMNEFIEDEGGGDFMTFTRKMILLIQLLYSIQTWKKIPSYLYGYKRIDYTFVSPTLAEFTIKAGHHQFHQHFITDHKRVYLHADTGVLFDTIILGILVRVWARIWVRPRNKIPSSNQY